MYELIYVEVNIICIIILGFILYNEKKNIDKQAENIAFDKVVIATAAIIAFDILWAIINANPHSVFSYLNAFINTCYMFLSGLISYFWLMFTEHKLNKQINFTLKFKFLIRIPLFILGILCVASPWTKWLFFIDDKNIYHRGNFHFIQLIISYAYLFSAATHSLQRIIISKERHKRSEARVLLSFVFLPAIGGIIGIFIYGLPIAWPCSTLSLLMVYIDFQTHQISTDGLTGLNNRRQLDKYLLAKTTDMRKNKKLYLMLADINSFKKINDTFGHVEGDKALIKTAELLKKTCETHDAFLARYGGDEFAVVSECDNISEIEHLKCCIQKEFDEYDKISESKYLLSLSMGIGEYSVKKENGISDMLVQADDELYQAKRENQNNDI